MSTKSYLSTLQIYHMEAGRRESLIQLSIVDSSLIPVSAYQSGLRLKGGPGAASVDLIPVPHRYPEASARRMYAVRL